MTENLIIMRMEAGLLYVLMSSLLDDLQQNVSSLWSSIPFSSLGYDCLFSPLRWKPSWSKSWHPQITYLCLLSDLFFATAISV